MPVKFYGAFFGLRPEEEKHLATLLEHHEGFDNMIGSSARMWREDFRKSYPDELECRLMFMRKAVLIAVREGIKSRASGMVIVAFALAVTDRVEQRVRQLDFEEGYVSHV